MTAPRKDASKITIDRNVAMSARRDSQDEQSSDIQKGYAAAWVPLTIAVTMAITS
jgi:hypothetical protein